MKTEAKTAKIRELLARVADLLEKGEDLEDYQVAAQMLGEWGFNVSTDDHEIVIKTSGDTYHFLGWGERQWTVKRVRPENGIEIGERQKLFANVEAESRCGSAAELAKAIVIFLTDL